MLGQNIDPGVRNCQWELNKQNIFGQSRNIVHVRTYPIKIKTVLKCNNVNHQEIENKLLNSNNKGFRIGIMYIIFEQTVPENDSSYEDQ